MSKGTYPLKLPRSVIEAAAQSAKAGGVSLKFALSGSRDAFLSPEHAGIHRSRIDP